MFPLVSFSTYFFYINKNSSLTPEVIKDNLQTGAKNSLGYIQSVRTYPFDDIPKKGLSESFSELQIRKNKKVKYFNGSRSVLQILEVEH